MSKEKVVIITGASSGIGRACAQAYLSAGHTVVLAARRMSELEKSVAGFESKSYKLVICDVGKPEQCKQLIDETMNAFGRIDVLINNAGISMRALFNDAEVSVLDKVMQINFWGMVYCTKAALPYIIESKGSVVGISSIAGYRGLPGRTGYSASKFAMNGFLESLRTELLPSGVHVLTVCPGFTSSNIRNHSLTADGSAQGKSPRDEAKMMTSEEVALRTMKAIDSRRRSLLLTRQGKLTVFLNKWFPKFMDKKIYEVMAKEDNSPFK